MPIDYKSADSGYFSKITSTAEALKSIDLASWTFFCTSALQALIIGFVLPALLVIPITIVTLAVVLKKTRSRVAAISLLALVVLNVLAQLYQMFRTMELRFGGLFVAAVLIWAAVRALQATAYLSATVKQEESNLSPQPTSLTRRG